MLWRRAARTSGERHVSGALGESAAEWALRAPDEVLALARAIEQRFERLGARATVADEPIAGSIGELVVGLPAAGLEVTLLLAQDVVVGVDRFSAEAVWRGVDDLAPVLGLLDEMAARGFHARRGAFRSTISEFGPPPPGARRVLTEVHPFAW